MLLLLRDPQNEIYAEYLIVVTLGGSAPVTFGIWKRFSDFYQLAKSVEEVNQKSGSSNSANVSLLGRDNSGAGGAMYKNAVLSWQCVLQRKRWFKSLDKDYLALKCFLLERFIHDVLFECQSPNILNKFLGLEL